MSLKKQVSAGNKSASAKATGKSTKPHWHPADRHKLISLDKIALLDHPATNKYWIGGKDGGKSRSVAVEMITAMENNWDTQGLALKKYKYGGIARLHTTYQNIALEIKALGYNIPNYEKGVSETYRMTKALKQSNQMIEYSSFDDANGLAGIEAKNLGYFAVVHIEEPVLIDDEGKLPTANEWRAAMSTIKKSVARSNRKYMMMKPHLPIGATKYHYTMNPWDDHPIINDAEKIFPEDDFIQWVAKDYLKNHTKAVHHALSDSLYIRTTTLANPVINAIETLLRSVKVRTLGEWETLDKSKINFEETYLKEFGILEPVVKAHIQGYDGLAIWFQIEEAIRCKDSLMMASLLGLKYQGSSGNQKTWNMDYAKVGSADEILNSPYTTIKGLSVGWDIDLRKNRGLVATPIYYVELQNEWGEVLGQGAVVGKQRFVNTYGDAGNLKYSYWDEAIKVNKEIRAYTEGLMGYENLDQGPIIYVDENKLDLIIEMRKHDSDFYKGVRKAVKHGRWDIENRQRAIQTALTRGFLYIDMYCGELLRTMKSSYIKEGSKKRDESGKNEKEYDYINSFEYAYYPLMFIPERQDFKPIPFEEILKINKEKGGQ